MRIIARSTLIQFWQSHPTSKESLEAWYKETEKSDWKTPDDIKKRYPSASFLSDNRVCFNICGNNFSKFVLVSRNREGGYIFFNCTVHYS